MYIAVDFQIFCNGVSSIIAWSVAYVRVPLLPLRTFATSSPTQNFAKARSVSEIFLDCFDTDCIGILLPLKIVMSLNLC
jgi:hypothetical protein